MPACVSSLPKSKSNWIIDFCSQEVNLEEENKVNT